MKHDHEYFERVAADCAEKALVYGSDINPYTTQRPRKLWQDGYDGRPFNENVYGNIGSFNWRAYNLGVYAKRAVCFGVACAYGTVKDVPEFPPALPGQLYGNQN